MNQNVRQSDRTPGAQRYRAATQVAGFVVALVLVAAAATVGNLAAVSAAEDYKRLTQPGWAPPSWLFGPVWTVLYLLMAVAAWLVWRGAPWRSVRPALLVFLVQLILNAAWTPLFFGSDLRGLAFAEILVLLVAIAVTIWMFLRHSRIAAALLVPYFLWTAFAAALNFEIWRLNS